MFRWEKMMDTSFFNLTDGNIEVSHWFQLKPLSQAQEPKAAHLLVF